MMLALALVAALGITTLDGRPVDVWRDDAIDGRQPMAGRRALVLVFIRHDCPVSNRYVPELNRLYDEFHAQGIQIYVVYSGREHDGESACAHHAEYGLRAPGLLDPDLRLASVAGTTVTPEAAVFATPFPHQRPEIKDRRPSLVYLGRLDDRAQGAGLWRPSPTTRDLRDVLLRVARGEHVGATHTQAHGCYLRSLSH